MTLEYVYRREEKLKAVFSWLTRIGAGVKFGSRPVGWYQMHQCACIDILLNLCGSSELRCKGGHVQAKCGNRWSTVISTIELFQKADNKTRSNH